MVENKIIIFNDLRIIGIKSEKKVVMGHIVDRMKKDICIPFLIFAVISLYGGTFDEGKEYFLDNKPAEAALAFEKALEENPVDENVYMYLGLSYIQNDLAEKAVTVFTKGAELKGPQEGRFLLNAGNAYYSIGRMDDALYMYNKVIEEHLPEKSRALLNRANIYMKKEEYAGAVEKYKEYLSEEPNSDQKDNILKLISLIENKIAEDAAEAERLAAEAERLKLEQEKKKAEAAAEEERLRVEEERRKAEEAARQQALMNDILNSLSTIGEDTQNIAAESETINQKEEESNIDD